ncbi:hypothetical protein GQ42DRAFT_159614, partial [Ramicandelaber brevisporus]
MAASPRKRTRQSMTSASASASAETASKQHQHQQYQHQHQHQHQHQPARKTIRQKRASAAPKQFTAVPFHGMPSPPPSSAVSQLLSDAATRNPIASLPASQSAAAVSAAAHTAAILDGQSPGSRLMSTLSIDERFDGPESAIESSVPPAEGLLKPRSCARDGDTAALVRNAELTLLDEFDLEVDCVNAMHELEPLSQTSANYLSRSHPMLEAGFRPIVVDWMAEVVADYRCHRDTFHLAVNIMDRYLDAATEPVSNGNLQCYATAALSLAMKLEEFSPPTLADLTALAVEAFQHEQLVKAERQVLQTLNWQLSVPTLSQWLTLFMHRAAHIAPDAYGSEECLAARDLCSGTATPTNTAASAWRSPADR